MNIYELKSYLRLLPDRGDCPLTGPNGLLEPARNKRAGGSCLDVVTGLSLVPPRRRMLHHRRRLRCMVGARGWSRHLERLVHS